MTTTMAVQRTALRSAETGNIPFISKRQQNHMGHLEDESGVIKAALRRSKRRRGLSLVVAVPATAAVGVAAVFTQVPVSELFASFGLAAVSWSSFGWNNYRVNQRTPELNQKQAELKALVQRSQTEVVV